jgi:hypothetical protein
MPPFTIAAEPVARCSGVTEMPWPKAMVMVLMRTQWRGHSGPASSGSWLVSGLRNPILSKKARCASGPITSAAILAEAMLDE